MRIEEQCWEELTAAWITADDVAGACVRAGREVGEAGDLVRWARSERASGANLPPLPDESQYLLAHLPGLPVHAIFGSNGPDDCSPNRDWNPAKEIRSASLIFVRDVMTRKEYLVYGRKTLKRVARQGKEETVRTLVVELDYDTDELEKLLALVQVLRGRHDYE